MGKVTHVVMTGGTLEISDEKEFHGRYIQRILTGSRQHIVELKTENFKFYIDFDLKLDEKLSDEEAVQLFKGWESVVQGPVYVAKAPVRIVEGKWKCGFHLIWPDRVVTKQTYTKLRNSIVIKSPEYSDFIDSPSSGLRMLWSHKHPVGKPYAPFIRIHNGSVSHLDTSPNTQMLEKFTIRSAECETATVSSSTDLLEQFIRKNIKGQGACNVKKLVSHKQGTIVQTDSSYCENLRDVHRSNHIWFMIKNNLISQRCHCKCDVTRKSGKKCKDFVGKSHILPPSILEELDPVSVDDQDETNILAMF
jgi:hypothetical protein